MEKTLNGRRARKRYVLSFAALRGRNPATRRAAHPRTQIALRLLKAVKVKGGRDGRLCVAPAYARQWERFLSI